MDIEAELRKKENKSLEMKALLGKRLADWSAYELQKYTSVEALQDQSNELENTLLLIKSMKLTVPNQYVPKPFNPTEYKISFPFFEPNGEAYLTLVDREQVLSKINDAIMDNKQFGKYRPIIISTSRGMGKTFLMKMIALQRVPSGLESQEIKEAGSYGRILSFDFAKYLDERSIEKIGSFFPRLMIFYLCMLFDGCEVDGIFFSQIQFDDVASFKGDQDRFNIWKQKCLRLGTDWVIGEYIRLTNIAFSVNCATPPVFLLDEIQLLCSSTTTRSGFDDEYHTIFSLLLSKLAGTHKPVCICSGTNNGKILKISEKSLIVPQVLSLTPLKTGYIQNWNEMTKQLSKSSDVTDISRLEAKTDLVFSLVHATYKIPRLLTYAHSIWYNGISKKAEKKDAQYLIEFEEKAASYYSEMRQVWMQFTPNQIAHIMFATGCRWAVPDPEDFIPGTNITWNFLIQRALIFPYDQGYYLFPFGLVWSESFCLQEQIEHFREFRDQVERVCKELVANIDMKHLFPSYSKICGSDPHSLGLLFEKIIAASFAVKYYLLRLTRGKDDVLFRFLYTLSEDESAERLKRITFDFSEGIDLPVSEGTVFNSAKHAVTRNRSSRTAHHDLILYSKEGPIPVQIKNSFKNPRSKEIKKQLKVFRNSADEVDILIWIYLGDLNSLRLKTHFASNVVFLNGSGVCNGMSMDILCASKIVASSDIDSS